MRNFIVLTVFVTLTLNLTNAQDSLLVDNIELHKIQRNLLQENEEEVSDSKEPEYDVAEETTTKAPIVYKGIVDRGVPEKGPKLFYDGKNFVMRLGAPIRVHIFNNKAESSDVITVDLDGEADSITGSKQTENSYKVNIDWKTKSFGNNNKINSISIHMYFETSEDEFIMSGLEVASVRIDATQIINMHLQTTTKSDYKVVAPIHSSFCCYDPGMFMPKKEGNENNEYTVGLTFPYMQLQYDDFDANPEKVIRFGPEWDCDSFVTVEGLVGFFITLLFASVCVWGFCMLGNIQTMDRFDDPRGKTIHVPAGAD